MSIRSKIQALITAANTKTGESDTTLTDAVQSLVDGYGQGGGGDPWELIADYTSDAVSTIVAAGVPSAYQNEALYKIEILVEFRQPEYPYAYINGATSNYESAARTSNVPYLYTGYVSRGERFKSNVTENSNAVLFLSSMSKPANYPVETVGIKSYYADAIKAGCNIKVWRLKE